MTFHQGDYKLASPSKYMDLPQTRLEPELVRFATQNGFRIHWNTEFKKLEQTDSKVTVELFDKVGQEQYSVLAKYVFGADGAESRVAEHLQTPMTRIPEPEWADWAVDVYLKADLSHLMKSRPSFLNWVLGIHRDHALFNMGCIVRMVKPWNEWVFSFIPVPIAKEEILTNEQYLEEIRHVIGDETPVEIINVSKWRMSSAYAENYSAGRV